MTTAAKEHRLLGEKLLFHQTFEPLTPEEEEEILSALDDLWYQMTEEEHEVEHQIARAMAEMDEPKPLPFQDFRVSRGVTKALPRRRTEEAA